MKPENSNGKINSADKRIVMDKFMLWIGKAVMMAIFMLVLILIREWIGFERMITVVIAVEAANQITKKQN